MELHRSWAGRIRQSATHRPGRKNAARAFVVAISSYGRSQLYRLVDHQHWPKIKVVHCGLETDLFTRGRSAGSRARRLVCVGRLCEQKGQLLLVEAHAPCRAGNRVRAGARWRRRVACRDRDADHAIQAAGQGTHHRLDQRRPGARRNQAARALVLPSFAEGLPVVIMEAMALKRPVISTYVAGIPELVHPVNTVGWCQPATSRPWRTLCDLSRRPPNTRSHG